MYDMLLVFGKNTIQFCMVLFGIGLSFRMLENVLLFTNLVKAWLE